MVLSAETDPTAALQSLADKVPAYKHVTEDHLGYPASCIKCGKPTVAVTTRLEGENCGPMFIGNGACPDCHIRFSASSKEWKCLHYKENDLKLYCDATVGADCNYICSSIHDDPDKFSETRKEKPRRNRSIKLQVEISLKRKATAISTNDDQE